MGWGQGSGWCTVLPAPQAYPWLRPLRSWGWWGVSPHGGFDGCWGDLQGDVIPRVRGGLWLWCCHRSPLGINLLRVHVCMCVHACAHMRSPCTSTVNTLRSLTAPRWDGGTTFLPLFAQAV